MSRSIASGGFTLVELLISLLLFALISLAGVGLVETVIGVQDRTELRSDRLAEIQRALFLITADFEQLSAGPLSEGDAVMFTRGSTIGDYPVIYRLAEGSLYRQAGSAESPILGGIEAFNVRYLKSGVWTGDAITKDSPARPKAVELTLILAQRPNETSGPVRRVIELPDEL
jgi:general secretion pathway protein J